MAPGSCPEKLPKPGEIVHIDFRAEKQARPLRKIDGAGGTVKLLQWNIERGYQLPGIIEELRRIDADVISLQEIDIACERSNWEDTGSAIGRALGLNYVFICEFEELHSPLREPRSQGGGVHGNALLTKFDVSGARAVEHSHHPVNWEAPEHELAQKEPRRGRRLTLAATVHCPQGDLLLYNCHLEVFCGISGRLRQFADILDDSRRHAAALPAQAILGDLNTMAHGIARLSRHYCCDRLRWATLGMPEAKFWADYVFTAREESCSEGSGDGSSLSEQQQQLSAAASAVAAAAAPPPPSNPALEAWFSPSLLPPRAASSLLNPGFADPFDPVADITLDNPKYRLCGVLPLMAGKLDWLLLRGPLAVASTHIGNHSYEHSDHKWIAANVTLGKS